MTHIERRRHSASGSISGGSGSGQPAELLHSHARAVVAFRRRGPHSGRDTAEPDQWQPPAAYLADESRPAALVSPTADPPLLQRRSACRPAPHRHPALPTAHTAGSTGQRADQHHTAIQRSPPRTQPPLDGHAASSAPLPSAVQTAAASPALTTQSVRLRTRVTGARACRTHPH